MTIWDDFIYFGEEPKILPRKQYLDFCLNCGDSQYIVGYRYKLRESQGQALLLEKSKDGLCKHCQFPVFTSCNYTLLTKKGPIPNY